uniref:Uncharacterized protein n=1 Tax=Knipowitschia caucasica TaxID=637954 RepID=A0AAV2JY57_KNICA
METPRKEPDESRAHGEVSGDVLRMRIHSGVLEVSPILPHPPFSIPQLGPLSESDCRAVIWCCIKDRGVSIMTSRGGAKLTGFIGNDQKPKERVVHQYHMSTSQKSEIRKLNSWSSLTQVVEEDRHHERPAGLEREADHQGPVRR